VKFYQFSVMIEGWEMWVYCGCAVGSGRSQKSPAVEQQKLEDPTSVLKQDFRTFNCETWHLEPTVRYYTCRHIVQHITGRFVCVLTLIMWLPGVIFFFLFLLHDAMHDMVTGL